MKYDIWDSKTSEDRLNHDKNVNAKATADFCSHYFSLEYKARGNQPPFCEQQ